MKKMSRLLALMLCVLMLVSIMPIAVLADYNANYQSETHTVFKHTEQTLAPGIEQYTNYAYSSDGKQMVYYVTTADINRDDVVAQVAYKDMQNDVYGMDKLSNMVACANAKYSDPENEQFISEYYTVVSACNGDGYDMTTGEPSGVFIMGGNVKKDWSKKSNPQFLAILKDGSAVIGDTQEEWDACKAAGIQEAIDVFGSNLVWDSQDVTATASGSYNTERHSRTMIGVTADGKLVTVVVDGRQEPFSCGATMHELAQIMLEAGCVRAFNLDGGGSTTCIAKNEGSNKCTIINRPSDGSERSISNGIIIASLAVPSDVFDHVNIKAADEYITPGSSTKVTVAGVSPAGTSAEIPEGITYDVTNGILENGILTATNVGDVVITAKCDGKAVGAATVHAVIPEKIKFASTTITVPYGKTAVLDMVATYGLNEVVTNDNDFSFTIGNSAAGTIEGMSFTACDEEAGLTETSITAAFVGTELTAEATLAFGKGSEVLFDFEDGTTNGFYTGYGSYNYYLPKGGTSVVTAENGKVHSGEYALAVNIDYTNSQESGYQMNALARTTPEGEASETVFKAAKSIGCWLYIPDEYVGLWVRWVLYPASAVNADGSFTKGGSITSNVMDGGNGGTGVVYSFNEPGWHYLSCDFSNYAGAVWSDNIYFMQFYISDRDGAEYNYYAKQQHNINGNFTVYIDDITVDYSSVIDDREAPVFSAVTYATTGMSDAATLSDGASIASNTVDFAAAVAENTAKVNATGIDEASAKAYVDGNEVPCTYTNGTITMDNSAILTAGKHTVKFSVCDKQGNYASIIRTVNITSGSECAIKVVPHDASLDRILFGSLYYVDVNASDIQNVKTVTTTLNLDSMSKWELDHMTVAEGFDVSYTYEPADKVLQLTITKTGNTELTGEQTLVSIPVRVWELDNVGSKIGGSDQVLAEGNKYTYAWFKSGNEYWKVAVEVRVQQGCVTLADGSDETFAGTSVYCDTEAWAIQKFMVETQEGVDYKANWNGGHIHSAAAIADKAATCTEAGYTDRTFCEECNSVVDWGTTIPATGHSYDFNSEGIRCCTKCQTLFTGEYEGVDYVDGIAQNGWVGESYYVDGAKLTGIQLIDDYYYDFGDNGVCAGKTKYTGIVEINGVNYYSQFGVFASGWKEIEGEWYYFMPETFEAANGECTTTDGVTFQFANGKVLDGIWVVTTSNGRMRYWYGPSYYKLTSKNVPYLVQEIDGKTYLFNANGFMQTGLVMNHRSNEDTPVWYDCGEDGVAKKLEGPMLLEFGGKTYYVDENGESPDAGLVCVDGDYYYVIYTGEVKKDSDRYVNYSKANGLVPEGMYHFDADGKMVTKNGVIDGYYYENNQIVEDAGLVCVDGDYYYVVYSGAVKKDADRYVNYSKANGLVPEGMYHFDADGKMVTKNGIVDGYYYVNNEIVEDAGLVCVDGDYYYVVYSGAVKKDADRYVNYSKANGLVPEGMYHFDADGKMVLKNGIVDGYYYVNNEIVEDAGLICVDGDYYFVVYSGAVKKDADRYVNYAKANGLVPEGMYHFDADGKMVLKNGIVDGYYYVNNEIVEDAGLVCVDGDYYFVVYSGAVKKDADRYVNYAKANGLVPEGMYHFDADGKMVNPPV